MSEKKKRSFPTAFTVLFIILILAAGLTYLVPSGKFSRLTYDDITNEFVITDHNDEVSTEAAINSEPLTRIPCLERAPSPTA